MAPIPTSEKRPFIPAPGVLQLEAVSSVFGQFCENVFHVQFGSATVTPTDANMLAAIQAVEDWERNTAHTWQHAGVGYNVTRARDLTVQPGRVLEQVPATAINGVAAGDALPNNVSVAVTARTHFGGRSYRGRTYWMGLARSMTDGTNALTPTARSGLVSAMADLRTRLLEGAGATLVVLSFASNKFWRDTAVATPIINFSCDGVLDSQRRRLPGRGK